MRKASGCLVFMFLGMVAFCQDGSEDRPDRPRRMRSNPGHHLIRVADENHDHRLERTEWDAFLASLPLLEDGSVDLRALHERMQAERTRRKDGSRDNHPLDVNGDGQISSDDFELFFATLDRNGDEVLERAELPRPPRRHGKRSGGRSAPREN